MGAQLDHNSTVATRTKSPLARAFRGSSLVRFGALSLTILSALFWARQKLISPTPRMAVANPPATVHTPPAHATAEIPVR